MLNNCHLSQLIAEQAKKYGERAALSWRDYEAGCWRDISWREFALTAHRASRSLLALGVREQENVAVFSENKPECLFTDFGAYGVRAVTIPFYATSSGAQVVYMMNDAQVRFVFVGEQQQYDTVASVLGLCEHIESIILFDPTIERSPKDQISMTFEEFLALGDKAMDEPEEEICRRLQAASWDDTANILYTSGTTGQSKGVVLTYGMYHEGFRVNDIAVPLSEDDVILDFLPFTHVFERAWSYLCLCEGARLAINQRPHDVLQSLQEVHPSCMCSVPRFWEKVYQGVLDKMDKSSAVQRRLIQDALSCGSRVWTDYRSKGLRPPFALGMKYRFYCNTVIKLLKKTLGLERANFFPTAGAAVSPEVETFVHAADINMVVGYGLTESCATVSCDILGRPITLGSVGRLIDGIEVKFGADDEILLRGKTITPRYYKKPQSTADSIDAEGWFHTGDAGYLKNGELYLKERIKDLFKTSNGKYIAPQMIETKFTIDRYIEQAVIVADKHKFVSALIVPCYSLLRRWAEQEGITAKTDAELCAHPKVCRMIEHRLETLQQDLAHYEQVKRFRLLPQPFTIESGELTNTLKVKRRVVYEKYHDLIEQMYQD